VLVKEPNGSNDDLTHIAISANGTVLGSNAVETNWSGISDPALVTEADGTSLDAFFGGIRSTNASETNDLLNWSLSGDGGTSWSLVPGTVASEPAVYTAPMSAARLGDVMWQAWGGAFSHRGTSAADPPVNLQDRVGGGCCGYHANIATDESTNSVMAAWYSNASSGLGVWAQPLDPNTGAPVGEPLNMPGSVMTFQGSQETASLDDRTPLAALPGRGFYIAYPSGYPGQNNVRVWKVGDSKSRKVSGKNLSSVQGTTVTATPEGRLWVALTAVVGGKRRMLVARSNVGATKWGSFVVAKLPPKTESLWSIYAADNPSGTVDLLAVATAKEGLATWHSQAEPGLTLDGPAKFPHAKKTQTFHVLEAGDPIGGAKVKVAGVSGTTDVNGKINLKLGPFAKKKKSAKGTATKPGYTTAVRRFLIKK
jgi:hypothetical protein